MKIWTLMKDLWEILMKKNNKELDKDMELTFEDITLEEQPVNKKEVVPDVYTSLDKLTKDKTWIPVPSDEGLHKFTVKELTNVTPEEFVKWTTSVCPFGWEKFPLKDYETKKSKETIILNIMDFFKRMRDGFKNKQ